MRLLELRDEVRTALGAKFDLKAFHDVVLGTGSVPLDELGEVPRGWVQAQQAAAAVTRGGGGGAAACGPLRTLATSCCAVSAFRGALRNVGRGFGPAADSLSLRVQRKEAKKAPGIRHTF